MVAPGWEKSDPCVNGCGIFRYPSQGQGFFLAGLEQPRPQANTTPSIVTVQSPLTSKSLPQTVKQTHTALWLSLSSHWNASGDKKTKVRTEKKKRVLPCQLFRETSRLMPKAFYFQFCIAQHSFASQCMSNRIVHLVDHGISLAFWMLPKVQIWRRNSFDWSTPMQLGWFDIQGGEQHETITWLLQLNFPFWGD